MTGSWIRGIALGVAFAGSAAAAPTTQSQSPAHGSSAAATAPISIEIVDPVDPIDPGTIELWLGDTEVTVDASVTPIADGYAVSYTPPTAYASGHLVTVTARASSPGGDVESHWRFHIDHTYPVGTLVIDMTSPEVGENRTYHGYGVALELARRGYVVNWLIDQDKAYEGIDFTALVDDRPKADPGPDGRVETMSFSGGPFLLPDPDPSTSFNEVWDIIAPFKNELNLDPRYRELQEPLTVDFNDVFFFSYRPRVAVADTMIATVELDLIGVPYTLVDTPGALDEPTTLAGGGMFHPSSDPSCGRARRHDVFIQSHYNWNDSSDSIAAMESLDEFLDKAGMAIFECASASVENTMHWITEPPGEIVEGTSPSVNYAPDPTRLGHPFLQTLGPIPIEGGGFSIWDDQLNQMKPNLQNILVDPLNDDIGYVFGAIGSGKVYYMGGHQRSELANRRLVVNALLYSVTYPKYSRGYDPPAIVTDEDNQLEVEIRVKGGSPSLATVLEDRFDASTEFVPGSLEMRIPGTSHSYDPVARALRIDLGDIHPTDFENGVVGTYRIVIHPTGSGPMSVLNHTSSYDDAWGASYALDTVGCSDVHAGPHFEVEKVADTTDVLAEATTRITLRLVARNNHGLSSLRDVLVTDTLPPAVGFVPGSITVSRGTADWGQSALDTLTWEVGNLPPHGIAMLTFDVDVSPAFPSLMLLNDGAHGRAIDVEGELLEITTPNVLGRSNDDTVPQLDFSLTPDVTSGGPVSFEFCATNHGRSGNFIREGDGAAIVLTFPEGFTDVTSFAPVDPALTAWTGDWEPASQSLTLRTSNTGLATGEELCFTFDMIAPDSPWLYKVAAFGLFEELAWPQDLPVVVVHAPDFSLPTDANVAAEPCETAAHLVELSNSGNGNDIFNLTASSSQGSDVRLHADTDGDGILDPGEPELTDSDGDGLADTGSVVDGTIFGFLVVVPIPDTAAPLVDLVSLTATSLADPAVSEAMTIQFEVTPMAVDISPDSPEICQGTVAVLDAGPGFAWYDWSSGDATQTVAVSPDADTVYTVTVDNDHGCSVMATETVYVLPSPQPSITANPSTEICAGDTTFLDAGLGYSGYVWSTTETASMIAVAPSVTTDYTVTVEAVNGCTGTADATVVVNPTPVADAGPSWTMCDGETAILGTPPVPGYSYSWTPVAGLDDPSAAQPAASPLTTTTYTVVAIAPGGCQATADATVTLEADPRVKELGNVLRLARSGRDVISYWTEPASTVEIELHAASVKDHGDASLLTTAPGGLGSHVLADALDAPGEPLHYRVLALTCGATPDP